MPLKGAMKISKNDTVALITLYSPSVASSPISSENFEASTVTSTLRIGSNIIKMKSTKSPRHKIKLKLKFNLFFCFPIFIAFWLLSDCTPALVPNFFLPLLDIFLPRVNIITNL